MRVYSLVVILIIVECGSCSYFKNDQISSPFNWNYTIHLDMIQLSATAYCPQEEIERWVCPHCMLPSFQPVQFIVDNDTGVFGYIGLDFLNERISEAVQTYKIGSLILGLPKQPLIVDGRVLKFMMGFMHPIPQYLLKHSQAFLVRKPLVAILHNLDLKEKYPSYSVFVTGHSLGAALSVLAAIDLQMTTLLDITVYNYGGRDSVSLVKQFVDPRVGNEVFSHNYRKLIPNTFRIVNERDVVPHLPFEFLGFYHIPREVWFTNGTFIICNDSGEDPGCSDSLLDSFSVADHTDYMGVGMGDCN